MRRPFACLSLLCLSVSAFAAAEGLFDDADALARAQQGLDQALRKGISWNDETHELLIDASAPAPVVAVPFTWDVQWGSGHGGSLHLVRFEVGEQATRIEHLSYRAYDKEDSAPWSARRAEVPTSDLVDLVSLARVDARTTAEVRRRADAPLGGSSSSSTADFYVLSRLTAAGAPVVEREYCGYHGSRKAPLYAGVRHVVRTTRDYLEGIGTWTDVPPESLRETHFDEAFAANADLMLRDFHWWVMERSVEMTGIFGTEASVTTLYRLDRGYEKPQPRQRAKIRNALRRPHRYLTGEPKRIPDTLDPDGPDVIEDHEEVDVETETETETEDGPKDE